MTDQELIKALRGEAVTLCHITDYLPETADRLEALLAENERLYHEVARLKAESDHFREVTKKLWCGKRYCKDAVTPNWSPGTEYPKHDGRVLVEVKNKNGETMHDTDRCYKGQHWVRWGDCVIRWCGIVLPPSTEGVE